MTWDWQDMVGTLPATDQQRRSVAHVRIHRDARKLHILEGTVPKGYPEPGLFQQSMGWVDKDGRGIRYQQVIYSKRVPRNGRLSRSAARRRPATATRQISRQLG
jgi:hypothetical protein